MRTKCKEKRQAKRDRKALNACSLKVEKHVARLLTSLLLITALFVRVVGFTRLFIVAAAEFEVRRRCLRRWRFWSGQRRRRLLLSLVFARLNRKWRRCVVGCRNDTLPPLSAVGVARVRNRSWRPHRRHARRRLRRRVRLARASPVAVKRLAADALRQLGARRVAVGVRRAFATKTRKAGAQLWKKSHTRRVAQESNRLLVHTWPLPEKLANLNRFFDHQNFARHKFAAFYKPKLLVFFCAYLQNLASNGNCSRLKSVVLKCAAKTWASVRWPDCSQKRDFNIYDCFLPGVLMQAALASQSCAAAAAHSLTSENSRQSAGSSRRLPFAHARPSQPRAQRPLAQTPLTKSHGTWPSQWQALAHPAPHAPAAHSASAAHV